MTTMQKAYLVVLGVCVILAGSEASSQKQQRQTGLIGCKCPRGLAGLEVSQVG